MYVLNVIQVIKKFNINYLLLSKLYIKNGHRKYEASTLAYQETCMLNKLPPHFVKNPLILIIYKLNFIVVFDKKILYKYKSKIYLL